MRVLGILLYMTSLLFIAMQKKHILGQIIAGFKTNKKDLEVDWKALEKAEKNI
jgi:hypothetical protein